MKLVKQSYIDGYKVTMYKLDEAVLGGYYVVELSYEGVSIYKDSLSLDAANYLMFSYIKDGVQISEEFKKHLIKHE